MEHIRPESNELPPVDPGLITGVPKFEGTHNEQSQHETPVFIDPHDNKPPTETLETVDDDPSWGYTQSAKERHGDTYQGRRLIGRDSRIDGGVYYGNYEGEAIVVDSEKYPDQYNRVFELAKQKATGPEGKVERSKVLEAVFETVTENMRYSKQGVAKLLKEIAGANDHQKFVDGTKVSLSDFLEEGVGVCRHQALAVGVILEKMKEAGHIRGQVSIDRSQRWSPKGEPEGHAWVRYTSKSGQIMILDVAQGYLGLLEESEGRKRGWDYLRPKEQLARTARDAGRTVTPQILTSA